MKVEKKGHSTIIKDTKNNITAFIENLQNEFHSFTDQNLILDISHYAVSLTDLPHFKTLAAQCKKSKKSFVVVAQDIDFNDAPKYLTVVPSVLEAHDIVEMEEIERDLGF